MTEKTYEPTVKTNKKVPEAIFIENIEDVIAKSGFENVKTAVDEAYNKYKLIESQLLKSNENMILKIPEIEKALDIIHTLKKQKQISIDYQLTESVWTKAKAKDTSKIAIWLGANTMVEFTLDEAQKLLSSNLENAKSNLQQIKQDLNYVKDQVTTSEVNIARIHNYSVNMKKEQKKE